MSELHGNIGPTRNYENLTNLPSINDVKVVGNLTQSDLGLADDASVEEIRSALENKVDKVTGKGLSENDYTDGEKAKLEGIEAGAEKNVQSDWDASDGSDAFIKNKPSVLETVTIRGTATTKSGTNTDLDVYKTAEVDSAIDTLDNKIDTNVADLDERKAEIDGYYETFTSGQTNQLIATEAITDTEPYIYRKTGGPNDVGDRVYDTLVGGSVVWNQLIPTANRNFVSTNDDTREYVQLAVRTFEAPYVQMMQSVAISSTGKRDFLLTLQASTFGKGLYIVHNGVAQNIAFYIGRDTELVYGHRYLLSMNFTGVDPTTVGGVKAEDIQFIDLTAALGSTIADYVYSLETATAGAGVAWVRRYFSKEYYAYAEPHFEHVQTSAKCTVGFNQWDEEWENGGIDANGNNVTASGRLRSKNHIPAFPETVYYMHVDSSIYPATWYGLFFYDENKQFISTTTSSADRTFTTPVGTRYIRFHLNDYWSGKAYTSGICINIHGDRDGEYEPYRKRTYPLDSSLTLRGIPKLDSANRPYFDGDIYRHDGTVTRRYGVYTYDGSENWLAYDYSGKTSFRLPNDAVKTNSGNCITDKGFEYSQFAWASTTQKLVTPYSGYLYFRDPSIETVADWKASLQANPITVVCEIKEPTTETAEPFQSPMVVDPLGTEEFVDYGVEQGTRDVSIPVGHSSKYPADLRGKLQRLPSPTGTNGDYIVTEVDGKLYLKPYVPAVGLTAPTTEGEGE